MLPALVRFLRSAQSAQDRLALAAALADVALLDSRRAPDSFVPAASEGTFTSPASLDRET